METLKTSFNSKRSSVRVSPSDGQTSKPNYALLEYLEHKPTPPVPALSSCQVHTLPEEMYCLDCNLLCCLRCIDDCHTEHGLKKPPVKMIQIRTGLLKKSSVLSKQQEQLVALEKQYRQELEKQNAFLISETKAIEDGFDTISRSLKSARTGIIEELSLFHKGRVGSIIGALKEIEEIGVMVRNIESGIRDIENRNRENKYCVDKDIIERYDTQISKSVSLELELSSLFILLTPSSLPPLPSSARVFEQIEQTLGKIKEVYIPHPVPKEANIDINRMVRSHSFKREDNDGLSLGSMPVRPRIGSRGMRSNPMDREGNSYRSIESFSDEH